MRFDTAVLSWVDDGGFPFSVRCKPERDGEDWMIRPTELTPAIRPGRAGLLWHSHNNKLWRLRMAFYRGTLRENDGVLIFTPSKWVSGVAGIRKRHMLNAFVRSRRMTRRYLAHRGLNRPAIPWERINQLKKQVPKR